MQQVARSVGNLGAVAAAAAGFFLSSPRTAEGGESTEPGASAPSSSPRESAPSASLPPPPSSLSVHPTDRQKYLNHPLHQIRVTSRSAAGLSFCFYSTAIPSDVSPGKFIRLNTTSSNALTASITIDGLTAPLPLTANQNLFVTPVMPRTPANPTDHVRYDCFVLLDSFRKSGFVTVTRELVTQ